ncbi:MAG: hypothetical protein KBD67_00275 [Anaerolineaceae bacterium]|nr:hypothetical protein [Anaerolineaceae bacterium]
MNRVSTELIVVVVAIVIFYVRIAMLRGKKKRYERDLALKRRKVKGRSKGSPLPQQPKGSSWLIVRSWALVIFSMLLMLAGIIAYNNFNVLKWPLIQDETFISTYAPFWYIPVSAGVILMAFSLTIRKPIEEVEE